MRMNYAEVQAVLTNNGLRIVMDAEVLFSPGMYKRYTLTAEPVKDAEAQAVHTN